MKRKNFKEKGIPLSIYFEPDVIRRLDSLASAFGESRSALANQFISERLDYYEEMVTYAYQKAAERGEHE